MIRHILSLKAVYSHVLLWPYLVVVVQIIDGGSVWGSLHAILDTVFFFY